MHYKKVKGILSPKNGMNIYRGCTHGCIYCDSRSKCYQINHDFTDIEVKENAIELLDQTLSKKRKKGIVSTGSMTDPYIHIEEKLQMTRKSLEIILKHECGLNIQTKSTRILRDFDLLKKINERSKCVIQVTLTTVNENLCKIIEPNVSTTKERVEILLKARDNGIPTVVWLDPILPFINDSVENLYGILNYCIEARVYGIICFGFGLTLREGNREYFYQNLDKYFPGLKEKYQKQYGNLYEVLSPNNEKLMKIFKNICDKNNIKHNIKEIFEYMRTVPVKSNEEQLKLF